MVFTNGWRVKLSILINCFSNSGSSSGVHKWLERGRRPAFGAAPTCLTRSFQDNSKIPPRCLQDPSRILPRCLQDTSKILPGYLHDPSKILIRSFQNTSKILPGNLQDPSRILIRSFPDISKIPPRCTRSSGQIPQNVSHVFNKKMLSC